MKHVLPTLFFHTILSILTQKIRLKKLPLFHFVSCSGHFTVCRGMIRQSQPGLSFVLSMYDL